MNPMRMRPRDATDGTMSRRFFLKVTAAAGAGLTLGLHFTDAAAAVTFRKKRRLMVPSVASRGRMRIGFMVIFPQASDCAASLMAARMRT